MCIYENAQFAFAHFAQFAQWHWIILYKAVTPLMVVSKYMEKAEL